MAEVVEVAVRVDPGHLVLQERATAVWEVCKGRRRRRRLV